jgi:hypothetical protein
MNNKSKLKKLQNKLTEINHNHPKIDWGGCGTFSYYVSNILDSIGINNQIVYIEEKDTPINAFRCEVKFTHILVKTDYCYIDNHSFYNVNDYKIWNENIRGFETPELKYLDKGKLHEMLDEPRLWNNVFGEEKRYKLSEDLKKLMN